VPRVEVVFTGQARGALAAIRETQAGLATIRREAGQTARSLGETEQRIVSTGRSFSLLGIAAKVGLASAGIAAVKAGISFDDLRQRSQIAFETMLGSGRAARRFLDDLARFAARTPFEFPDLIRASQRLLAMGFQARQIIPVMRAVGDAVAAMGGDPMALEATIRAIGQIQAKGRLMAEEMMQLNEAGTFSWRALAKEIGTSVPKAMDLVKKGAITSDIFLQAFMRNSERNFKGMMERQSRTFSGMISTLKDNTQQALGKIMLPVFQRLTRGVERLNEALDSPEGRRAVKQLAQALDELIDVAGDVTSHALRIARAIDRVVRATTGWRTVLEGVLALAVARKLAIWTAGFSRLMGSAGGPRGGGAGILGAAAAAGALLGSLRALAQLGAIAITIKLIFDRKTVEQQIQDNLIGPLQRASQWLKEHAGPLGFLFAGAPSGTSGTPTTPSVRGVTAPLTLPVPTRDTHGARLLTAFPGDRGPNVDAGIGWPAGTVVGSPVSGVIYRLSLHGRASPRTPGGAYGDSIYILGDDGYMYFLTHFLVGSILVKPGQRVARGEPLGQIAPYATPHIHIERSGSRVTTPRGAATPATPTTSTTTTDLSEPIHVPEPPDDKKRKRRARLGRAAPIVPIRLQTRLAEAELTPQLRDDISALEAIRDFLRGRLKGARGERRLELLQELKDVTDQLRDLRDQLREAAKAAREAEAEALRKRRERARDFMAGPGRRLIGGPGGVGAVFEPGAIGLLPEQVLPTPSMLRRVGGIVRAFRNARRDAVREATGMLADIDSAFKEREVIPLPQLRAKIARLKEAIANAVSPRELARLRRRLARLREMIPDSIDAARQRLEARRSAFQAAFQRLASRILEAFDRETRRNLEQMRRQTQEQIRALQEAARGPTPAEQALADLRARREAERRAQQMAELQRRIAEAETPEERAQAERELQDLLLDEEEARLERQAELEREARERQLDEQIRALEDAEAAREQDYEDQRAALRQALEDQLAMWEQNLADREASWDEFQAWLLDQNQALGLDPNWFAAGAAAGGAWAEAFVDELHKAWEAWQDFLRGEEPIYEEGLAPEAPEAQRRRFEQAGGKIRPMQHGGVVNRRTVALIGEAGREAVIPLHDPRALAAVGRAIADALDTGARTTLVVRPVVEVDGQRVSRVLASPMGDALSRVISYRLER
jgi:tape measure domain-containing protein